jgi:3-hydroxyacyl-CoA dehydrogenase/enoyl-CoA hydratase/3-hydroxybutyryl-CoA epimerase
VKLDWKDGKPVKSGAQYSNAELEKLGRDLIEPMVAESQKSLDEGVVETADLVDAGMIFGTGFAPFRGGPLHYKSKQTPSGQSPARAAAE